MKIILQATEINRNVQGKLRVLFDEPVRHHIIWNGVYNNYADTEQVREFFDECRTKIQQIMADTPGKAEYYVITSGGVLHTLVLSDLMREVGINNYKYLVYEPKVDNYVVLDRVSYLGAS